MELLVQILGQAAEAAKNPPLSPEELLTLSYVSFALACAAGLARIHDQNRYRDFPNLLSLSFICGFAGFACTGFLVWVRFSSSNDLILLWACSALVGLAGDKIDDFVDLIFENVFEPTLHKILSKLGFEVVEKRETEPHIDDDDLTGPQV